MCVTIWALRRDVCKAAENFVKISAVSFYKTDTRIASVYIYSFNRFLCLSYTHRHPTNTGLFTSFVQTVAVHCENYNKHIAICVKNAKLITLQHVVHVVTTVLHTDEDKETSALLIFQSCNVTYSIQCTRELAAVHYVTLLGTVREMRSNGYLIAVHSFQRPTL